VITGEETAYIIKQPSFSFHQPLPFLAMTARQASDFDEIHCKDDETISTHMQALKKL
jgi:hypothetical protein